MPACADLVSKPYNPGLFHESLPLPRGFIYAPTPSASDSEGALYWKMKPSESDKNPGTYKHIGSQIPVRWSAPETWTLNLFPRHHLWHPHMQRVLATQWVASAEAVALTPNGFKGPEWAGWRCDFVLVVLNKSGVHLINDAMPPTHWGSSLTQRCENLITTSYFPPCFAPKASAQSSPLHLADAPTLLQPTLAPFYCPPAANGTAVCHVGRMDDFSRPTLTSESNQINKGP